MPPRTSHLPTAPMPTDPTPPTIETWTLALPTNTAIVFLSHLLQLLPFYTPHSFMRTCPADGLEKKEERNSQLSTLGPLGSVAADNASFWREIPDPTILPFRSVVFAGSP